MEWTDETIARLKALWQEGLSTAEIGRQIGITKNAVVGKAHRLGLPPRPSPIRRQDGKSATAKKTGAEGDESKTSSRRAAKNESPSAAATDIPVGTAPVSEPVTAGETAAAPTNPAPMETVAKATPAPTPVRESVAPALAAPKAADPQPAARLKAANADQTEAAAASAPAASRPAAPRPTFRSVSSSLEPRRRGPSCCWPLGDPGTPGFHFCGATPLPGKPYCAEHAALAYVKLRDRRDNVA